MKKIENIQYITQDHNTLSHADQALLMFKKGIKWVQLRMKNAESDEVLENALTIQKYANTYNGVLIINDSIEVAQKAKAKAIHLGLNDWPINEARSILGDDVIIGGTANTFEDVLLQYKRGADYVGLGPFQFTTTKKNLSPIVGLEGYRNICKKLSEQELHIPIFAVGGITLKDIPDIKQTGINNIAISTDLLTTVLNDQSIEPFIQ